MSSSNPPRRLSDRVYELLTNEVFYQVLKRISYWINQAGMDTTLDDIRAKTKESKNIVGLKNGIAETHLLVNA